MIRSIFEDLAASQTAVAAAQLQNVRPDTSAPVAPNLLAQRYRLLLLSRSDTGRSKPFRPVT